MIKVTGLLKLDDVQIHVLDTKDLEVLWDDETIQTVLVIKLDNATLFFGVDDTLRLVARLKNFLRSRGEPKEGLGPF